MVLIYLLINNICFNYYLRVIWWGKFDRLAGDIGVSGKPILRCWERWWNSILGWDLFVRPTIKLCYLYENPLKIEKQNALLKFLLLNFNPKDVTTTEYTRNYNWSLVSKICFVCTENAVAGADRRRRADAAAQDDCLSRPNTPVITNETTRGPGQTEHPMYNCEAWPLNIRAQNEL